MKLGYLQGGYAHTELEPSIRAISESGAIKTQISNRSDGDDWDAFKIFLATTSRGDTVVINSLMDFCVSMKDLFHFWALAAEYGVRIESAAEAWFDTSKSEIGIEELERFYFDCITTSTKRGLDRARDKGRKIGRRVGSGAIPKTTLKRAYDSYFNDKQPIAESCKAFGISETTLYRYMRKNSLAKRYDIR